MQSIKEQSLIDSAERIIRKKKAPLDLYELFNLVCAEKEFSGEAKKGRITQFYTDLITSAKFVYTGDNTWDLKEFQKTELREKDGSFYKEYTVIKDIDGEESTAKPKAKKKAKPKAKKKPKAKVKPVIEEIVEVVVEPAVEPAVKPAVKEKVKKVKKVEKVEEIPAIVKETKPKKADTEGIKEYEEEVFEEIEDEFDEEKYNEYMDTYEDKYDEK